MLKVFRRRKFFIRILLFVIVGVVGLMMVITLIPGLGTVDFSLRDPQGLLAKVGGQTVTQVDAQRAYSSRVRQQPVSSEAFRHLIMQSVIDNLITQRAVEYEAGRLGLEVSPEEVTLRLRQISLFYPGGKFVGAEAYRQMVEQQLGISVPQFEEQVREQALLSKVFLWVTGGLTVAPDEVEQEYRRQQEQVKIDYAVVRAQALGAQLQPTEDDLRAYYQANRDRYPVPEKRAVRFVPLDQEELARRTQVSADELEAYYQSHRQDYHQPERVRVRHILFLRKPGETAPVHGEPVHGEPAEGKPDPLRQQAEEALKQVEHGANFAALAKKDSQDTTTADKGGEIGWVQRGQAVPELEKALFSAPTGKPELVATGYGFHIIEVEEHQAERVQPLSEVRSSIERILLQQKVQQAGLQQARAIVDAVRGGKSLDDAARQAGWTVQQSQLFTRDQTLPAFGDSKDFQEAAFRLPADSAGQPNAPVSDPVAVPAGYAILQLKQVTPAHTATFEEIRTRLEQDYRKEKGAEKARAEAQKLAAAAQKSEDLRAAAKQEGLTVAASDLFARDGTIPGLGSVQSIAPVAFSLPVGGVSPALAVGEDWVVFRVAEHKDADLSQLSPDQRKSIRDMLLQEKQGMAWTIFTTDLRKRLAAQGKLQLNQAAIDRLTGKNQPGPSA